MTNDSNEPIDRPDDEPSAVAAMAEGEERTVSSAVYGNDADETRYLLGNPVNAARLKESIAQLEAGEGTLRTLIES